MRAPAPGDGDVMSSDHFVIAWDRTSDGWAMLMLMFAPKILNQCVYKEENSQDEICP